MTGAAPARDPVALRERLAALAPPGPEEPPIGPLVGALRDGGWLAACAPREAGGEGLAHEPADPLALLEALAAVGEASLSAGRLFEGHVNAVKLVALLARGEARARWLRDAARGRLFGVWGADAPEPARLAGGRLSGAKVFASGADVVERAVVSARDEEGRLRLLLLDRARLDGRLDPAAWSMTGMIGTASGRCDLEGLVVGEGDLLGGPDDYLAEPHFRGGVWRYAAVWMGAMRGVTRAAAAQLEARGQAEAPLQAARLLRMAAACETARLWLGEAARAVERPGAPPEAAAAAILARLRTGEEAVGLLAAADEALGLASFDTGHPVERRRRDLLTYLRQADPDGMGRGALATLRADPTLARRWSLA